MLVMEQQYNEAVTAIKQAILQSQYRSVKLITGEQLSLYFGIGRYVSANSRTGTWGTGAISRISERLKRELPGLRGFSEQNIRNVGSAVGAMPPYGGRFPTACLRTVRTRLHVYGSPPITAF